MKEISLDNIRSKLSISNYKLDYKNILNPEQYEAVCTTEGNIMILAGAGTGKTYTMVHRVAYLIENGVQPENILLLTFTKKAAMEMTRRANRVLDDRCSRIYSGTYHSFSANMLRIYGKQIGLASNFTILDQSDAEDVINLVRAEMNLDKKERKFPKKGQLMNIFSSSINKDKSIEEIVEIDYPELLTDLGDILACHKKYTSFKKERQLLDYDDLLVRFYELLTTNENVANKISEKFKYIQVDEYQDSNILQSKIILKLSQVHQNLTIVGDIMQSIYLFRGAHYKNMENHGDNFDNLKIIKLNQNYRSVQPILDFTNEIMKQSDSKYYNPLESIKPQGLKPAIVYTPNVYTQAMYITQQVLELYEQGCRLKDIAVLARNAHLSIELQMMLTQANIPFAVFGGRKILDSIHIRDIISFVKILENPLDAVAWLRVLELFEGVGPSSARKILANIDTSNGFKFVEGKELENLKKKKFFASIESLVLKLDSIQNKPFTQQFDQIVKYYLPIMEDVFEDHKNRKNDIEVFSTIASQYKSAEKFLTDITLDPSEVRKDTEDDKDCLTISTIHSAKGLEWDTVFVLTVAENIMPSSKAMDNEEELAEELRIAYVAMTRAKNRLIMTIPAERSLYGGKTERTTPSRFLTDIDNIDLYVEKYKVK